MCFPYESPKCILFMPCFFQSVLFEQAYTYKIIIYKYINDYMSDSINFFTSIFNYGWSNWMLFQASVARYGSTCDYVLSLQVEFELMHGAEDRLKLRLLILSWSSIYSVSVPLRQ